MAYSVTAPQFSFVQFNEDSAINHCSWKDPFFEVLPIVNDNDLAFQFFIDGEEAEIDSICSGANGVQVGIANNCAEPALIIFEEVPERARVSSTRALINWAFGLTAFSSVIEVGQCFVIMILIDEQPFCSSTVFKRNDDTCYTTVVDFSNEDNFAGFNYCGGGSSSDADEVDCTPLEIEFTNVPDITIPYTADMLAKYGTVPTVQVWIYDGTGVLVDMGIRVTLDSFPPSQIFADFGGISSGVIKIS